MGSACSIQTAVLALAVHHGGTSLSKGHGVIQRMSEDIDFKLALPTSWSRSQARRKLNACRKELAETMRAADFDLPEAGIVTLNESRYFCFSLGYLPQFPLVGRILDRLLHQANAD